MCETCGCAGSGDVSILNLKTGERGPATTNASHPHEHVHADGTRHSHDREHTHDHGLHHGHGHPDEAHRTVNEHLHPFAGGPAIALETRILAKNDTLAERNRAWFAGREILAINLLSGPGAGKTTLLEKTIAALCGELPIFVIEGDQATANDAERIRDAGAEAVQVNTGTGCHLDADMIARGLTVLKPSPQSLLIIENVGNLVCPALFDLGEGAKVVIFSTTEGEDKPLKYPHMFKAAKVVLLNKIDLLPHLDFDISRATSNVQAVNSAVEILELSCKTGEGLAAWLEWLQSEALAAREAAFTLSG